MTNVPKVQTLKWKAQVEFEGDIDHFRSFVDALGKQDVKVSVSELTYQRHLPGYITPALAAKLSEAKIQQMVADMPRVTFAGIKGIAGGIRTPHLHMGDEVVLVDRERFKTVLGELAQDLVNQRVDKGEDYFEVVKPLAG